jgi:hypothetical protein
MANEDEVRVEPTGRKSSTYVASDTPTREAVAAETVTFVDRIRWSAVWVGLLVALSVQLILTALTIALGGGQVDPAAGTVPLAQLMGNLGVWSAIWAIVGLFIGGWVAASLSGTIGTINGMWNGVAVWALALVFGTVLAALGTGGVLGYMGTGFRGGPAAMTPMLDPQAWEATRTAATWFVIGSIVALMAAIAGGAAGARHLDDVEPTRRDTEPTRRRT